MTGNDDYIIRSNTYYPTVGTTSTGYTCSSCGGWVAYGLTHSCPSWRVTTWPQWQVTSSEIPYGQLPECPDEEAPKLYRCKDGHWHPMPTEGGAKKRRTS
jgi:hypothetical protein